MDGNLCIPFLLIMIKEYAKMMFCLFPEMERCTLRGKNLLLFTLFRRDG